MLNQFSRTQLLLGADNMDRLSNAKVAVFGIGGVGGYVVEALARSGVGSFVLVDDDKVCLTNINRQIIATRKTVGKYKVDVMKERILEINPDADVEVRKCFYLPENAHEFPFEEYSYVVDAVDTVTAKIEIIMRAKAAEIPVISCMGAGNKLDVRPLEDMSISCRQHCVCPPGTDRKCTERRDIPGSIAFVPSVAGLILAGEVVKDLTINQYGRGDE